MVSEGFPRYCGQALDALDAMGSLDALDAMGSLDVLDVSGRRCR